MRMSRAITLFNQQEDMNPTTKLAIEFATMIANGWTSRYGQDDHTRHAFPKKFWYYNGADGFNNYTSGNSSSDCSAFITTVWAVATATAYKTDIAYDDNYVKSRKLVPLSRNITNGKMGSLWCPSTEQMVSGNGIFKGFLSYGFEAISAGSYLKPGDVCVINQNKATGADGHTFMILEPSNEDWYWDGNQKYFKVVHCSGGDNNHAIRIQDNWGIKATDGRRPTVLRYTFEH